MIYHISGVRICDRIYFGLLRTAAGINFPKTDGTGSVSKILGHQILAAKACCFQITVVKKCIQPPRVCRVTPTKIKTAT